MLEFTFAVLFRINDNGQVVFNANTIGEPPHMERRADEIMEFAGAVLRCGVIVNVIV